MRCESAVPGAQFNAVADPAREKAEREKAEEARIRASEQLERRQVRTRPLLLVPGIEMLYHPLATYRVA